MLSAKERIEINQGSFTESDQIIYQAITSYPGLIERCTVMQLAEYLKISTASVMRFAKKLGYSGYSEFRYEYMKDAYSPDQESSNTIAKYTHMMIESFEEFDKLEESVFIDLVEKMKKANHIYVVGSGKSGLVASFMAYSFVRCNASITSVTDTIFIHDLPKILKKEDLVIYISEKANHYSNILSGFVDDAKEKEFSNITIITCNANSPFKKTLEHIICVPNINTNQEGFRTHALFLSFIDILYSYYVEQK